MKKKLLKVNLVSDLTKLSEKQMVQLAGGYSSSCTGSGSSCDATKNCCKC